MDIQLTCQFIFASDRLLDRHSFEKSGSNLVEAERDREIFCWSVDQFGCSFEEVLFCFCDVAEGCKELLVCCCRSAV